MSTFAEIKSALSGDIPIIAVSIIAGFTLLANFRNLFGGLLMKPGHSSRVADGVAELKTIRESGVRDGARVLEIWNSGLRNSSGLGHEKWAILEQVFIAALDTVDNELAWDCLEQLRFKFKKSSRVARLFGMYLESTGRFDDAHELYDKLLTDEPTNTLVRKRKIAMLKAQRKNAEAIDQLREYLSTFMTDFEAWSELADLYLIDSDFKHAAFCLEELLLFNPNNHLYCQRYAEIKYTEGGSENLQLARTYFTMSCQLNPNNLRSLYGLLLTTSALDHQLSKLSLDCSENQTVKEEYVKHAATSPNSNYNPSLTDSTCCKSQQPSSSAPVSFPTGPLLNRELANWAQIRIRQVYMAVQPPHTNRPPVKRHHLSKPRINCENMLSASNQTNHVESIHQTPIPTQAQQTTYE